MLPPALTAPSDLILRASAASLPAFDRVATATGLLGSLALLPIVMVQGAATKRRVPILPAPKGEFGGCVEGVGVPVRLLAMGKSSVSGIGLSHSEETVAAVVTARALNRSTNRPVIWQALGLSGAVVRDGIEQLLPRVQCDPVDLLIVAFGVNDATSYRSPTDYADDLATLVTAVRNRVGNALVIVAGVAPLGSFPALPWPLRSILGWRSKALQAAIEKLPESLTSLVVERVSLPYRRICLLMTAFIRILRLTNCGGRRLRPRQSLLSAESIASIRKPSNWKGIQSGRVELGKKIAATRPGRDPAAAFER